MTKKEIIDGLQMTIDLCLYNPNTGETITEPRNDMDKITVDTCKAAIELLEQEPCEDAISRQAAIVALDDRMSSLENVDMQIAMGFAKGIIHELPPVTPQPKMGRWINDKCSICGEERARYGQNPPYCPDCGAKMKEVRND